MRLMGDYQVTLNGFRCNQATWDNASQLDGAGDEVFIHVGYRTADDQGNIIRLEQSTSSTIGAPGSNRYPFGSATNIFGTLLQGIADGDEFPYPDPGEIKTNLRAPTEVPPFVIWQGQLISDWEGDQVQHWAGRQVTHENFVFITPTIWERDPGENIFQGWLDWQIGADQKFGQKAKEIVANVWPLAAPVFDAVHLGLMTIATLDAVWGRAGTRPIGTAPQVITLTQADAEYYCSRNNGVIQVSYRDPDNLRGDYDLYLQVHRLDVVRELPPRNPPPASSGLGSVDLATFNPSSPLVLW